MLDSHIVHGNIKHKRLALQLLNNFVVNSDADALKISKDLGIMMRIFEAIQERKDPATT